MVMIQSTSIPKGTLKKKHVAIAYHIVHKQEASSTVVLFKGDTKENFADMLTNALPAALLLNLCKKVWSTHFLCL